MHLRFMVKSALERILNVDSAKATHDLVTLAWLKLSTGFEEDLLLVVGHGGET